MNMEFYRTRGQLRPNAGRAWKNGAKKLANHRYATEKNYRRQSVQEKSGVKPRKLWGYGKTRYRGLKKNGAEVYALANFYMARDKLLKLSPC